MGYFRYVDGINRGGYSIDSLYSVPVMGNYGTLLQTTAYIAPPVFTLSSSALKTDTFSLSGSVSLGKASSYGVEAASIGTQASIVDERSQLKPGLFKGRLAGQEALVSRLCQKYNVSPALVASIICEESGYGTSKKAYNNNFMGYRAAGDLGKDSGGFGKFSTIEKGLEAGISNLARYTRFSDVSSVDFNNLDAIGRHYCEGGVWASHIRNVYNTVVSKYLT